MSEDQKEKIGIIEKIKELFKPKKKKKNKTLFDKFFSEKKKTKPLKKRVKKLIIQLKDIFNRIKSRLFIISDNIKTSIFGVKNRIENISSSVSDLPTFTKESAKEIRKTTEVLAKETSTKTKSFWQRLRKRIDESPPFVQKHMIDAKLVEKSLMVTADNMAVFHWIKDEAKTIDNRLPAEDLNKEARIRLLEEEITQDIDSKPLSQTLVKCIELAALTGNHDDVEWMKKELNGYVSENKFITIGRNYPDYRKIKSVLPVKWYIKGQYSLTNDDIQIPFYCTKPVQWIEENITRCKKTRKKEIITKLPIPSELSMIKEYYKKDTINAITSIVSLEYILNKIKVRIHEFMFKITSGKFKKGLEKKKKRKKRSK